MAAITEPVAAVGFVDSPSLTLPATFPQMGVFGGTPGIVPTGQTSPVPMNGVGVLSWWDQRQQHAQSVLNKSSVQVDTPFKFDYSTVTPALGGTANPTVVTTKSGVAYLIVNGALFDMPSSTNNLIANPQAEAWYFARKVAYFGTPVASSLVVPLLMNNATANNLIQIAINSALSTTHHYLLMDNGSGAATQFDLGAQCALGGALCPVGAPVTMAVWFDLNAGTVNVTFQDVLVASIAASSGGLAKMPILPLAPMAEAFLALPALTIYGGFAMIKGAST